MDYNYFNFNARSCRDNDLQIQYPNRWPSLALCWRFYDLKHRGQSHLAQWALNSPPSLLAIVLIRLFFWVLVCECSLIKYFGVFWRCLCLRQGCFITCKSFPRLLALLSSSLSTKMAPKLSFQLWETFIAGLHNMLNGSWRIKQKANKAKPHVLRGQQQFLIACVKNIPTFERNLQL